MEFPRGTVLGVAATIAVGIVSYLYARRSLRGDNQDASSIASSAFATSNDRQLLNDASALSSKSEPGSNQVSQQPSSSSHHPQVGTESKTNTTGLDNSSGKPSPQTTQHQLEDPSSSKGESKTVQTKSSEGIGSDEPCPERLDVWTSEGVPTGKSKSREEVHRNGDWHPCVHIWLYYPRDDVILIQRRLKSKESWGGFYDVSCAGHIPTGEEIVDAGIRELEEELGIKVSSKELVALGMVPQEHVLRGGTYIDNEFAYVFAYILPRRIPENEYKLQESEVESVEYMPLSELIDINSSGRAIEANMVPLVHFDKYKLLFEKLRAIAQSVTVVGSSNGLGNTSSEIDDSKKASVMAAEEDGEVEGGWIRIKAKTVVQSGPKTE